MGKDFVPALIIIHWGDAELVTVWTEILISLHVGPRSAGHVMLSALKESCLVEPYTNLLSDTNFLLLRIYWDADGAGRKRHLFGLD